MLSYFGCDQSQVQRYLTAKSIDEGRSSLMMSAFVKIPLQALILLTGVLVFAFYLFTAPPMLFNPVHQAQGGGERASRRVPPSSRRGSTTGFERAAAGGRLRLPTPHRAGDAAAIAAAHDRIRRRERRG